MDKPKANLHMGNPHKGHMGSQLNTYVPKVIFTPVCAQEGSTWTPHFEYFLVGISVRNLHLMCIHPKTTIHQKKERSKNVLFQNGGQKTICRFAKKVT